MNFEIQNTVDAQQIANSARKLTETNIIELSAKVRPELGKLTPKQFLFLLGNLASNGHNFENNLALIDQYFSYTQDLNLKLQMELFLGDLFLKQYETEDAYRHFYEVTGKYTKADNRKVSQQQVKKEISFFCHSPVLLAHTNPMFKMLSERDNTDIKINILSLGESEKFTAACESVGARFLKIDARNYMTAYDLLLKFTRNHISLVWLCLPAHLSYVASRSSNLTWWSLKMHPSIEGARSRLHIYDSCTINGFDWQKFDCGFTINNLNTVVQPFQKRSKNFGSFCREELLNNIDHWKNVGSILSLDDQLIYSYTGRKKIHDKWCSDLKIDPQRVNFLGWLEDPYTKLKEMAFLLDGVKLGHGVMALEAIAAKVPVLSPTSSIGGYLAFLLRNFQQCQSARQGNSSFMDTGVLKHSAYDSLCEQTLVQATVFKDKNELLQKAQTLLINRDNDIIGSKLHSYLAQEMKSKADFNDFVSLVSN